MKPAERQREPQAGDDPPLDTELGQRVLREHVASIYFNYSATFIARLAFIGDITARTETSRSLRDFVHESNQGGQIWFVRDRAELEVRLSHTAP